MQFLTVGARDVEMLGLTVKHFLWNKNDLWHTRGVSAAMGITSNTPFDFSSTCVVLAQAVGIVSLVFTVSTTCDDRCLSSISNSSSTFHDCNCSLRDVFLCAAQRNTILLEKQLTA